MNNENDMKHTDETIWKMMGEMQAPEPSQDMEMRFRANLQSYKNAAKEKKSIRQMFVEKLQHVWTSQPRLQLGYIILFVVMAFGIGYLFLPKKEITNTADKKIDTIKQNEPVVSSINDVEKNQEINILSQLNDVSAAERMKAVSYTSTNKTINTQVIDALFTTLNNDPNVNVRLVTLEALTQFAADAHVREGLVKSILLQESPLMQAAIADVMVKLQEKNSLEPFKKLLDKKGLDGTIKNKIEKSIRQII